MKDIQVLGILISGSLRDKFLSQSSGNKSVISAGGHVHDQDCQETDSDLGCVRIMSGGGGYCKDGSQKGFYVVNFDKNKKMYAKNIGLQSLFGDNPTPSLYSDVPPDTNWLPG